MRISKFVTHASKSAALVGMSLCLFSNSSTASDLLSVYESAIKNDNQFSAAMNEYQAVKQGHREAKGLYYPTLDVAYELIQTDQQINRSENDVFGDGQSDFDTDDLTLRLSQPIFRWDYLSERRKAKAEVRQAEYLFVAAEQELMLRTAEAYLLTLAAGDNAFVTNSELEAIDQQLALAEKRLDVGLASPTEVHESRARFQLNQSEAIQADNAVIDRQEGLQVIAGEDVGELMPLAEDFAMVAPEPADPDVWIAMAVENNLSVKAREASVGIAEQEVKLRKAGRYPTLDLVARFNNRDSGGSLFGGGSDVDTNDVVLRAGWTVFQGGSLRARIKQAVYNKQRAEDELELERSTVRRATRNAYLGVVSSIARADALKASLDAQELTVQSKQKGFETGSASNIEVLDAKRDFFFVQRDYLEARYDYLLSMLNLKRQAGQLSPDDLSMINGLLDTASIDSVSSMEEALAVEIPEVVTEIAPGAEDEVEVLQAEQDVVLASGTTDGGDQPVVDALEQLQIDSHQWLFDQSASGYSAQVASFNDEQNALDYIDRQDAAQMYHFRSSSQNGKETFFVLVGAWPDRESAEEAAEVRGFDDIWVRKVGRLQSGRCQIAPQQSQTVLAMLMDLCQEAGMTNELLAVADTAEQG